MSVFHVSLQNPTLFAQKKGIILLFFFKKLGVWRYSKPAGEEWKSASRWYSTMLEVNECDRGKQCKAVAFSCSHLSKENTSSLLEYTVGRHRCRHQSYNIFPLLFSATEHYLESGKAPLGGSDGWSIWWAFTRILYLRDLEGREGRRPPENTTETQYQITANMRTWLKRSGKEKRTPTIKLYNFPKVTSNIK